MGEPGVLVQRSNFEGLGQMESESESEMDNGCIETELTL